MIRTRQQAEEWARLVNRHTGCCASVTDESPRSRFRDSTWTAHLTQSVIGWICLSARPNRGTSIPADHLPAPVAEYLVLVAGPIHPATAAAARRMDVGGDWFPQVNDDDILRVTTHGLDSWVTFRFKRECPLKPRLGIRLFCEVGESGCGPEDFIPLPVSEARMEQARAQLESYAEDLAHETGWRVSP